MNRKSYQLYKMTLSQIANQNFIEMQSKYISSQNISAVDFLESFRKLLDIDLMVLMYQVEKEKNLIQIENLTTQRVNDLIVTINNQGEKDG